MKFKSEDANSVKKYFLQLEEFMGILELIDSEWADVLMTDKTQMRDLGLSDIDYSFLEDRLGFKLPKTMTIMGVVKKLKSK